MKDSAQSTCLLKKRLVACIFFIHPCSRLYPSHDFEKNTDIAVFASLFAHSKAWRANACHVLGPAMNTMENAAAYVHWDDDGQPQRRHWRSAANSPAPKRARPADDRIAADTAYRLASEGNAMVWHGDFQNARLLLQAIARRVDRKPARKAPEILPGTIDAFNRYRQLRAQRARTLSMVLVPLDADYVIDLRRAPDVRDACIAAYGPPDGTPSLVSLRELQGIIGAYEWRKKGLEIPALAGSSDSVRIYPHYGVFAPVRSEYLDLVARAPLAAPVPLAFDIGTGTGVLAALLARRGVSRVIATDTDPRAIACAEENMRLLGLSDRVRVQSVNLFPEGRASLVVCNPPWIPARPGTSLDQAVYDPDSHMLRGFLTGLPEHLEEKGEGWLILSDLAVHLGLRTEQALLDWIEAAGLYVMDKLDARPIHPKVSDPDNPLHAARVREVTSLWRLGLTPSRGS
jgi:tRNA1(Val) A37 N6-methylase TrmN6